MFIIILLLESFSHQSWLIVFHWSLSHKSSQGSRTLLSILADFNNAVVWMVSTWPIFSKFSCPFTNALVAVPRASITNCITVTFMFHSFFQFLFQRYLSIFSLSFNFTLWSSGTEKSTILQVLFFLWIIIRSGRLDDIRWSVCIPKS